MPAEAEEEGFVKGWALFVGPALVVHNSQERAHGGAAFLQTVIEEVAAVDRLHSVRGARPCEVRAPTAPRSGLAIRVSSQSAHGSLPGHAVVISAQVFKSPKKN